jgi:hypothetical protein
MNAAPRSQTTPEEMEGIRKIFNALMDQHPTQPLDRVAVVSAFEQALDALGVAYGDHFRKNLRNDPPAAWTEAITWQAFRQLGWSVSRYEDPAHGGPDFVVSHDGLHVLVECTCLSVTAMIAASGLDPDRFTEMQGYDSIAPRVRTTVSDKTKQIGKTQFPGPRLPVIAMHDAPFALFHASLAEDLIAETESMSVVYGGGVAAPTPLTTLVGSALFRPGRDGIVAARQSISAILLMNAGGTAAHLCGIINPHARYPLDPASIPHVPWLTVTNQPTVDQAVATAWVWHDESQARILPDVRELMLSFDGSAALAAMTVFPREDFRRGGR